MSTCEHIYLLSILSISWFPKMLLDYFRVESWSILLLDFIFHTNKWYEIKVHSTHKLQGRQVKDFSIPENASQVLFRIVFIEYSSNFELILDSALVVLTEAKYKQSMVEECGLVVTAGLAFFLEWFSNARLSCMELYVHFGTIVIRIGLKVEASSSRKVLLMQWVLNSLPAAVRTQATAGALQRLLIDFSLLPAVTSKSLSTAGKVP